MKILILGSGGRESALAWKLAASPRVERVYVSRNVGLDPLNFAQVKEFVLENGIDMLVPGAEESIVRGIRDYFAADAGLRGLAVVAPGKEGARLEGSKSFAKAFMKRAGIPTADYEVFELREAEVRRNSKGKVVEYGGGVGTDGGLREAKRFLQKLEPPYVLKADGLAAGKGVLIEPDYESACAALEEMRRGKFGEAGQRVVIERFLEGKELSVTVLTDGQGYKVLPEAKDYKRAGEGDTGPNTGGMGAVSPVRWADPTLMKKVETRIIQPTLAQLRQEHISYAGFLYIGLIVVRGEPFVLEYNVRPGDPETEVILPRIESDLAELFEAVHRGT
ncbi:MAG: ATP-grasp domain-containing protein, partial [Bacteroidales bacterium]|nr:ATP-grasp domain-containing protein [Bacteroidales bacterium]